MDVVNEARTVLLEEIRIDGGTQARAQMTTLTVLDYTTAIEAGAQFPPVDLFFDGSTYWLADGFHRVHAMRRAGRMGIVATVHEGTQRDAVLFAAQANQTHGLKRTQEDKRRAVLTLLRDPEWRQWADSEIARRCNVSQPFVGDMRRSLPPVAGETTQRRYRIAGEEVVRDTEHCGPGRHPKRDAVEAMLRAGKPSGEIVKALHVRGGLIANVRRELGLAGPDKSRSGIQARYDRMREMAKEGFSSDQIAKEIRVSAETCRRVLRDQGIAVPGDISLGRSLHHNSTRIMDALVMDADNLLAFVENIDFNALDPDRFPAWIETLQQTKTQLVTFIKRLREKGAGHAAES